MYSLRYDKFFEELMLNEGWISDDKFDKGGHTIAGITKKYHLEAHHNLQYMIDKNYNKETIMAFIKSFYYVNYYNKLYDKIIDSSLAFKIFDFGVNAGIRTSIKLLQKTYNKYEPESKISVDGIFGENTLQAINLASHPTEEILETEFYHRYIKKLEKYYKSLWNFFRFGKGWLHRLKRVLNKTPNLAIK